MGCPVRERVQLLAGDRCMGDELVEGTGTEAKFGRVVAMIADPVRNNRMLLLDGWYHAILQLTVEELVVEDADDERISFSLSFLSHLMAHRARMVQTGIAMDRVGNVWIADAGNWLVFAAAAAHSSLSTLLLLSLTHSRLSSLLEVHSPASAGWTDPFRSDSSW